MTRFHSALLVAALIGAAALIGQSLLLGASVLVALFIVIGLGVMFPRLSLFGQFICRGDRSRYCVSLTFDDGPDVQSTTALLDLLRDTRVKAAFFCVGERVVANPELASRIVREGHQLENHSYAHSNLTNFFTAKRLRKELAQTQAIIEQTTGIAPTLFRPPMGLSNPRVFRAAESLGLKVIGWSARGLDTQSDQPDRIVARIVRRLEPGAIILLHDGNIPAARLVTTVKMLLDTLSKLGYEVVRLDKMLT